MYAEKFIAFRYLRTKKEGFISLISAFSLIGIALGVATLIVVMSVMNGFREELLSKILGVNGHIYVGSSYSSTLENFESKQLRIKSLKGITNSYPVVDGQALISIDSFARGVMVRGLKKEDVQKKSILGKNIISGNIHYFRGDGVLIGNNMALDLGIKVGDELSLISPQGAESPFGIMPRMKTFTIAGIVKTGMYEYDANFIFLPLNTAQAFFAYDEKEVSYLELFVEDVEKVKQPMLNVSFALGDGVRVYSWQDKNTSFFNALKVEKNVMFLILTLIILIAAFNIISGMIMLVKDKAKGIAIMKSFGASKTAIMKIFFITGSTIGVSGTFIGLILGVLITNNISSIQSWLNGVTGRELFSAEIYYLSQLPAKINYNEVVVIVLVSLLLSLLSTLYPAWKASRLDPVEALRYE